MSEFTKGPWAWDVRDDKWEHGRLDGADKSDVIELQDVYPGYPECGEDLVMVIKPEDAHLIAAAPAMYDALKGIDDAISNEQMYQASFIVEDVLKKLKENMT